MTFQKKSFVLTLVGLSAASLISLAPALAAAPKASGPNADVRALVVQLHAAIQAAQANTAGESEADKEAAIQTAIAAVVTGADPLTAQAALAQISVSTPAARAAVAAEATIVAPLAQQETQTAAAASTGSSGSGGGSSSAAAAGSAGAGGGGGGYVVSK